MDVATSDVWTSGTLAPWTVYTRDLSGAAYACTAATHVLKADLTGLLCASTACVAGGADETTCCNARAACDAAVSGWTVVLYGAACEEYDTMIVDPGDYPTSGNIDADVDQRSVPWHICVGPSVGAHA